MRVFPRTTIRYNKYFKCKYSWINSFASMSQLANSSHSEKFALIQLKNRKRFYLKQFKIKLPHPFPLNTLIMLSCFLFLSSSPRPHANKGNPLNENHIRWERVDYEMSEKTKTSFENGTSYLHISNAQRDDIGHFRCIADNRVANPISRDVLLIVKCKMMAMNYDDDDQFINNLIYSSPLFRYV